MSSSQRFNVQTKKFEEWKHLYDCYHQLMCDSETENPKPLWIFRGQRSEAWQLETRIGREFKRLGSAPYGRLLIEEGLVREFQRRVQSVDVSLATPESDNILGWLALMQHHGTPTRLLDWTYSFFVALYFAVEDADGDAAVWTLDARWCNRAARRVLSAGREDYESTLERAIAMDPYITTSTTFRRMFARSSSPARMVYRVNAFALHERLTTQQGLFLCPGDINATFEENLLNLVTHASDCEKAPVHKWIISQALRRVALRELGYMNIGRHSLFPGLDGFAQSLTKFMEEPSRLVPPWRTKQGRAAYVDWLKWEGLDGMDSDEM